MFFFLYCGDAYGGQSIECAGGGMGSHKRAGALERVSMVCTAKEEIGMKNIDF